MISIRSLNKFFNKGRQNEIHVINDISLELPEKGLVAIFGKSGCGKTTLLNVIGGLDKFGSGSLTIEGESIRDNADGIRNRMIGYIFQNYNLNKLETNFDNVADALRLCGMTDKAEIEERTMAALTNVGMEKYRARTPDTLSGGQQQRIAIARAIVKNPRIILADEPTGNLDEANTILIMDLLKQISKDHLVLLVTHEANLVDYYCDTVIELNDGRVAAIRGNADANGFSAKDKNHIYLGELERTELNSDKASLEYYGDAPEEPIRLTVVNNGGRLYIRVNTPRVQVLDDTSEIKLREGVYENVAKTSGQNSNIDMSKLPPVRGREYGKLFSFGSSVKSGYTANFKNRKLGKRALRGCMTLFAAVLVLMTAVFGTSFHDIINASNGYNHNVFYIYTPNGEVSDKLNNAVGDAESGIDYVKLYGGAAPTGDITIGVFTGTFETFSNSVSSAQSSMLRTNAVLLDLSVAGALPLKTGKNTEPGDDEILITTAVADALLETSTMGYITEYQDLVGLVSTISVKGEYLRIAGIVESDETAVYLTEVALSDYIISNKSLYIERAEAYGETVATGEALLLILNRDNNGKYPAVGDKIKIQGKDIRVAAIKENITDENRINNSASHSYLVSNADYIEFSKRLGENDETIMGVVQGNGSEEKEEIEDNEYIEEEEKNYTELAASTELYSSDYVGGNFYYTVVHSSNPKQTEAFLRSSFPDLRTGVEYLPVLITPDSIFEGIFEQNRIEIIANLTAMAVILALMCVCMYFIMRSSLMNRIKEIGIYRAIGVSKKNLCFRFLVESLVLTTLSVFVGYLFSSVIMIMWTGSSSMMTNIFYYPLWVAGILLVILYGVCLLCGIIPIVSLLRRTPSEILAKYDI